MVFQICGVRVLRHRTTYLLSVLGFCAVLYLILIRTSIDSANIPDIRENNVKLYEQKSGASESVDIVGNEYRESISEEVNIVHGKPSRGFGKSANIKSDGYKDNDMELIDPNGAKQNDVKGSLDPLSSRTTNKLPYKFEGAKNNRQKAVVDAMKHAWSNYVNYAWGQDELKPLSKGYTNWMNLGLTIVDSLDTLYIMGLTEEFKMARDWVAYNLTLTPSADIQLFEVVIRVLGGLLTGYHLSTDKIFLDKAEELGERLLPCLTGTKGIPCSKINLRTKTPLFYEISSAEVGTIQLELRDLSRSLGIDKYEKLAKAISDKLHRMPGKLDGLVPNFIDSTTGAFRHSEISVGASGDSYYEYLLKQWLQTGKKATQFRDDYLEAVEGMRKRLLRYTKPNHLAFMGHLHADQYSFRADMEHLACFLPGTLALGAMNGLDPSHLDLAANLTRTCYEMYASSPTGLSPEIAGMNQDVKVKKDIHISYNNRYNAQRPETIESLFYLYCATGDNKYRDWGWTIFESFEKWTRVEGGYSGLENVDAGVPKSLPIRRDKMESFYLAETLKYFYLLFADDELLPLTNFVFNTEAHPLPVYKS